MTKKVWIIILLIAAAILLFIGCQSIMTPPDIQKVDQTFRENENDIAVVREYLCNSGYVDFIIRKGDREARADGKNVSIADQEVRDAIKRLFKHYRTIIKSGSTITLEQWIRFNDVGCGIACTVSGEDLPEVAYLTELIKIPDTDWYYYIDDFNEWRIRNQTA